LFVLFYINVICFFIFFFIFFSDLVYFNEMIFKNICLVSFPLSILLHTKIVAYLSTLSTSCIFLYSNIQKYLLLNNKNLKFIRIYIFMSSRNYILKVCYLYLWYFSNFKYVYFQKYNFYYFLPFFLWLLIIFS
jgi:hypothetical protein